MKHINKYCGIERPKNTYTKGLKTIIYKKTLILSRKSRICLF